MSNKNTTEAILGQLHTRLSVLPAWSTPGGQMHLPRDVVLSNIEAAIEQAKPAGAISDGYHTFDELYAHRVRLFSTLMHAYPKRSWWSHKHHDNTEWSGWIIAGIDTPEGSVTYHLPVSEIDNLPANTEISAGKQWDGHTADDVLVRLLSLRAEQWEGYDKAEPEPEQTKWHDYTKDGTAWGDWYKELCAIARANGGSAADADAWREDYDKGLTPLQSWQNEWG